MKPLTVRTLDRGPGNPATTIKYQEENTANAQHKEYLRAVKEVKLDHIFRKPFVTALEGHTEGITRIVGSKTNNDLIASTDFSGAISTWDLSIKQQIQTIPSFSTPRALSFLHNDLIYSQAQSIFIQTHSPTTPTPTTTTTTPSEFLAAATVLDLSSFDSTFVAATVDGINIFDHDRIKPIATYATTRPPKRIILASPQAIYTAEDNHLAGYDTRTGNQEFLIRTSSAINAFAINPHKPTELATGLNSGEVHLYDILFTKQSQAHYTPPNKILRGHPKAIMDLTYFPNGQKLATASLDRTIRIFGNNLTHTQEHIYHNRRMQGINALFCTNDSHYLLSGSTDTNLRIWQANPNRPQKLLNKTEEDSRALGSLLKRKYSQVNQLSTLTRHIILPRVLKAEARNRFHHLQAQQRKEQNRQNNHSN
ncbi:DDB1- and CUL4-associated factor 13 [Nematocida homosporus]|uniref:DDB1- and CUL4-associated factor 13 n=1 Tax=Nematocida homosporus TaxID=1912981 RepID=UPI00221F55FB|nr:DDB1- and CUL4-associated factor 13 [Nematocida homosporus]KAI5185504.1 DDB1- and CUL4-associated factor 13 [Nematocida homosporus]